MTSRLEKLTEGFEMEGPPIQQHLAALDLLHKQKHPTEASLERSSPKCWSAEASRVKTCITVSRTSK